MAAAFSASLVLTRLIPRGEAATRP
jgi:hypothetical protein